MRDQAQRTAVGGGRVERMSTASFDSSIWP